MITLAQDAARLNEMADEVVEMARRLLPYIKHETREDLAFNVRAEVGGNCGNLRRAAGAMMGLDRKLERDLS